MRSEEVIRQILQEIVALLKKYADNPAICIDLKRIGRQQLDTLGYIPGWAKVYPILFSEPDALKVWQAVNRMNTFGRASIKKIAAETEIPLKRFADLEDPVKIAYDAGKAGQKYPFDIKLKRSRKKYT